MTRFFRRLFLFPSTLGCISRNPWRLFTVFLCESLGPLAMEEQPEGHSGAGSQTLLQKSKRCSFQESALMLRSSAFWEAPEESNAKELIRLTVVVATEWKANATLLSSG